MSSPVWAGVPLACSTLLAWALTLITEGTVCYVSSRQRGNQKIGHRGFWLGAGFSVAGMHMAPALSVSSVQLAPLSASLIQWKGYSPDVGWCPLMRPVCLKWLWIWCFLQTWLHGVVEDFSLSFGPKSQILGMSTSWAKTEARPLIDALISVTLPNLPIALDYSPQTPHFMFLSQLSSQINC